MANETWHYAENQFKNSTRASKKKMNIISSDHLSKLEAEQADPVIGQLFTTFKPVREDYATKYSDWLQAKGEYKGATQRMDELQEELNAEKIPEWDNQIKVEVGEDSSDYTTIMPNGRSAFRGGRDQVISEVEGLGKRLENYPALNVVKGEVDDFYKQLVGMRNIQQQKEELLSAASDTLEVARIVTADYMYGNLGALMNLYKEEPTNIERFYELQVIQAPRSEDEDEEEVEAILPPI